MAVGVNTKPMDAPLSSTVTVGGDFGGTATAPLPAKGGGKPLSASVPATLPDEFISYPVAPVGPFVITGSIQHYFADPLPNTSGAGGQRTIEVTQSSIAAVNSILPVMYGAGLRQGAMVAGMVEWNGVLYLIAICSHGKVRAFGDVLLDDVVALPTVYLEAYTGTATQAASARLTQAYASKGVAFNDAMPGVAYRVVGIPADYGLQNFPRITIEVDDGAEVADVRTGAAVSSANPVNALADMITSTAYGAGRTYDAATFKAAADYCDEQIGSAPVIARKRLALSLTQSMKIDDVITLLASYTGCFCWNTGGRYYLAPLRRGTSVAFFGDANILDGSFQLSRTAMRDTPTTATVNFTDTTVTPYHTRPARVEMPEVTAGTFPDRAMVSAMPGVTSYAQAQHDATEYLNRAIVARIKASWGAFDEGVTLTPGNVVTLHKPKYGLSNALMLVLDVVDLGFGRYTVNAETYADAIFSTAVIAGPPTIDTGDMVPGAVVAFVGPVTGVEALTQLQSGEWLDQIRFSWPVPANVQALAYYAAVFYDVTDSKPGVQLAARNTPTPAFVSDMIVQGRVYRLGVATVSYVGAASDVVWSADIKGLGKLLPPSNVTGLQITVNDQAVFLLWKAAADLDLDGYEVRRGTVGQAWAAMTFLDHLYGLTDYLIGQPAGTWDYAVKAHDTSGNYSVTEARATATIQAPDYGILASHTWLAAEGNMVANFGKYQAADKSWRFVSINSAGLWGDGADNPDNAIGTFADSLKDTPVSLPMPGTATLIWTAFDFGADYLGTWHFSGTVETVAGAGVVDVGCYLGDLPAYSLLVHTSVRSTDGGGNPCTTPAIDTTGADLLVVHVGSYNPGAGLSDNKGNVWAPLTRRIATTRVSAQFYYAKNPIVGPGHTFTSTGPAGVYPALAAAAFKGSDLVAPFDVENGGTALNPGASVQVGSITPAASGALIVAGFSDYQNFGGPFTIDSGMSIIESQRFVSGQSFGSTFAYVVQAAKAAINPTWGFTTSNGDYCAYGDAAFKVSTVAGQMLVRYPNDSVVMARVAQVQITVPAGMAARVYDDWRVTCAANVRQESGSVNVPASGLATVTLKGHYAQRLSLIVAAGSTAAGRAYATWSNVVLSPTAPNTFQITVVDLDTGAAKAATVDYLWKGL